MYTIKYDGKKLLEAICFEGVGGTIEPAPISFGESDIKKLVNSQVIINKIVGDIKENGDKIVSIEGYDLGRALVGNKNALYIAAVVEQDDAYKEVLKLAVKGNIYSIEKFKKTIAEYDKCVRCDTITPYKKSAPIQQRQGYVEGAGQLCGTCNTEIYAKK